MISIAMIAFGATMLLCTLDHFRTKPNNPPGFALFLAAVHLVLTAVSMLGFAIIVAALLGIEA